MDIGATNSRRLIRTESMHVIASSHHDVYTRAGVGKVEFVTAHDDRVCEECDSMDGEIFDLNDAPMIPQHPNARSILIPIID
jgi:SPP1 gp7 family putative phage head morphogenesis protein